jgi:hypothetical protein
MNEMLTTRYQSAYRLQDAPTACPESESSTRSKRHPGVISTPCALKLLDIPDDFTRIDNLFVLAWSG